MSAHIHNSVSALISYINKKIYLALIFITYKIHNMVIAQKDNKCKIDYLTGLLTLRIGNTKVTIKRDKSYEQTNARVYLNAPVAAAFIKDSVTFSRVIQRLGKKENSEFTYAHGLPLLFQALQHINYNGIAYNKIFSPEVTIRAGSFIWVIHDLMHSFYEYRLKRKTIVSEKLEGKTDYEREIFFTTKALKVLESVGYRVSPGELLQLDGLLLQQHVHEHQVKNFFSNAVFTL